MSIEQNQRVIFKLDKEIVDLQDKKAKEDKKISDLNNKISKIKITKNNSNSTINSKLRKAESYQKDLMRAQEKSAEYSKKIADKTAKRNKEYQKLQKEENKIRKDQSYQIKTMQSNYENRIQELQMQNLDNLHRNYTSNPENVEYDVFISHAWEDKTEVADPLVQALKNRNIKVWYDTNQIQWGNSIREQIDLGLKNSKFGIVILSPDYIKEGKYWTKAELDGLFQMESAGRERLLPIWHNLTKQQVTEYSPIIASKKALTTATSTIEEIADELQKLCSVEETENGKNENDE